MLCADNPVPSAQNWHSQIIRSEHGRGWRLDSSAQVLRNSQSEFRLPPPGWKVWTRRRIGESWKRGSYLRGMKPLQIVTLLSWLLLTDSIDYQTARKYWKVLKGSLLQEGNELVINCYQLKLRAADGKMRLNEILCRNAKRVQGVWGTGNHAHHPTAKGCVQSAEERLSSVMRWHSEFRHRWSWNGRDIVTTKPWNPTLT